MSKGWKRTLWIVGGLVLLLIVAIVVFVLTFDANKYKSEIAAAVNKATGRVLTIEGDIHLSIFPWLGAELGAMRLSNAPGFGDEPFAQIGAAAVKVKLLPLLCKEVEVDEVTLNGLRLSLRRDANGHTNWEDLAGKKAEEKPDTGAAGPVLASFALGGINLRDADIVWDDRAAATRYEISKLNLHTGPVTLDQPVRIDSDFDLASIQPALGAHVQLATQALYHFDSKRLELNGIELAAHVRNAALQDAEIKLAATALLDLTAQHYQMRGLNVSADLKGDKLPGKHISAALATELDVNLKDNRLTAEPLSFTALGVNAKGALRGRDLLTTPRFDGTLNIANFNVRDVMQALAVALPASADPNAWKEANARFDFTATAQDAALTELEIKLDQTTLRGDAAIANFTQPALRFHLKVDDFDADRYLPPPAPKGAVAPPSPAAPPAAAVATAGATGAPLDTLRTLDLDGTFAVGKLKVAKLKLSDIEIGLKAKNGLIAARPLSAKLYGGSYRGDLRLDARGKQLQLSSDDSLSNIAIGPLVQDYLEKDLIAGTGNITLQLTSSGASAADIRRGLDGKLGFSFVDGRVNGVNLVEMIQKDYLKYIQGLGVDSARLNQTVFSKFAATATVTDGAVNTDDLLLNSAQLNVKGRGGINLVNEQMDLRLDAIPTGQLAKQLGDFRDVVVPIKVQGTFTAPTYTVALDEALKQKAKARVDAEKKKLEEKLQQRIDQQKQKGTEKLQEQQKKLEQQLQDKLKGLFK